MFRVILVIVGFVAAAIWIEARWNAEQRELTLRLREPTELADVVRTRSRELGQRAAREARERLAPVAAPPVATEREPAADPARERASEPEEAAARSAARPRSEEHITSGDQQRLDRVIAEKTRGQ